ncbi:MAG: hypothetical protein ACPG5B_05075 [Chitinophagales bacterium]
MAKPNVSYRYPGSRAFEATEQQLFHGRTQEIKDLFKLVKVETLVVLFSKSGMGKSSLLNAGLNPLLQKEYFFPISIRLQNPKVSVLKTIDAALKPYLNQQKLAQFQSNETPMLWEKLKACEFGDHITPVLIFDQFEELFNHKQADKMAFAEQMGDVVNNHLPAEIQGQLRNTPRRQRTKEMLEWHSLLNIRVIFAIRSDRMSELHELTTDLPSILKNRFQLNALKHRQAYEAIVKPATLDGHFISEPFEYNEQTIEDIIDNLSNDKNEIESFQLQILCQYVEKKIIQEQHIKHNSLVAIKKKKITVTPDYLGGREGIKDILNNYYLNQIASLGTHKEQLAARKLIEEGLIVEGRRVGVAEAVIKNTYNINATLLTTLIFSRLVRADNTPLGKVYELSHDTLVAPILKAYDKRKAIEERIATQKEEEKERKKMILWSFIFGLVVVLLLASLIGLWYAIQQKNIADTQKEKAIEQTKLAEDRAKMIKKNEKKLKENNEKLTQEIWRNDSMNFELANKNLELASQILFAKQKTDEAISAKEEALFQEGLAKLEKENALRQEAFAKRQQRRAEAEQQKAREQKKEAIAQKDTAQIQKKIAETQEMLAIVNKGLLVLKDKNPTEGLRLAGYGHQYDENSFMLPIVNYSNSYFYENQLFSTPFYSHLGEHKQVIEAVKILGKNKNSVLVKGNCFEIIDKKGHVLKSVKAHQNNINSIDVLVDGKKIMTTANGELIKIWNENGELIDKFIGHQQDVNAAVFSADGKKIITVSEDKTAKIFDIQQLKIPIKTTKAHFTRLEKVAFSTDNKHFAVAEDFYESAYNIVIWNGKKKIIATEKEVVIKKRKKKKIEEIPSHTNRITSLNFSPNGELLASASWDKTAKVWTKTGNLKATLPHKNIVYSAEFSPNGKYIVTAAADKTVRIWSSAGKFITALNGHTEPVFSATFSADGNYILSAGMDNTVKKWHISSYPMNFVLSKNGINDACFSPDGKKYVTASSQNNYATIWNDKGKQLVSLKGNEKNTKILGVSYSKDGKYIAGVSDDGKLLLWKKQADYLDWVLRKTLVLSRKPLQDVVFSPNSKYVAATSSDGRIGVWNMRNLQKEWESSKMEIGINAIDFSPNCQQIAIGTADGMVFLYDAAGNEMANFVGHNAAVNSVAFSPDGKQVVSASSDKTAILWNLNGTILNTFVGHLKAINYATFSPSNKHIVTASQDGGLFLWTKEGTLLHEFPSVNNQALKTAYFSADSKYLMSVSSSSNNVILWTISSEELIERADNLNLPPLSNTTKKSYGLK